MFLLFSKLLSLFFFQNSNQTSLSSKLSSTFLRFRKLSGLFCFFWKLSSMFLLFDKLSSFYFFLQNIINVSILQHFWFSTSFQVFFSFKTFISVFVLQKAFRSLFFFFKAFISFSSKPSHCLYFSESSEIAHFSHNVLVIIFCNFIFEFLFFFNSSPWHLWNSFSSTCASCFVTSRRLAIILWDWI
jgi:hypothetical protein